MNPLSKLSTLLLAAALVCGMVLAPGCEKKKPPPPPAPPPPPPPPAEVSFDSIMQSLKADPRVQSAGSMGITDESFAQAAVKLADGFARGDAEALKGMMTARAKSVVDSLVADGTWAELTPRIEVVRIVYAGSPGTVGDLERQQGLAQMKAMWPSQIRAFEDILIKRGVDKNETARLLEQFKTRLEEEFTKAQFEKVLGSASTSEGATPDPAIGGDSSEMAILIAVQTPMGADLLGWTARKAGDNWVFNNASTLGLPRAKASEWDNVGMFGFSLGTGKAPVAPKSSKAADKPSGGADGSTAPTPSGGTPSPSPEPKLPTRDPRKLVPGPSGG